jgi:hypothetical protein
LTISVAHGQVPGWWAVPRASSSQATNHRPDAPIAPPIAIDAITAGANGVAVSVRCTSRS